MDGQRVGVAVGIGGREGAHPVGEGLVARHQLVGVLRPVEVAGQREPRGPQAQVDAQLDVAVALPAERLVVEYRIGVRMVEVDVLPGGGGGAEDARVEVLGLRIEDVERGELLGRAPAGAQRQAVVQPEGEVQTRRKALRTVVARGADPRLLGAQPRHELQRGALAQPQGEELLDVGREVVHVGDLREGPRAVVGRRERLVGVIEAAPHVAVGPPGEARLGVAPQPSPAADPRRLERGGVVELLGVDALRGVVARREHHGQVVPLLRGVDGRLRRGARLVAVRPVQAVLEVERGRELKVGQPRAVEQPAQRGGSPEGILASPLPLAHLGIGVVLRIKAADVARHSGVEAQHPGEGAAEGERKARARVGRIGRDGVLRGARILDAAVHHAPLAPEVEALRGGNLLGVGVGREEQHPGGQPLARGDAHQTRPQVAVLGRRDARYDLDRLDGGRGDVARRGARHPVERRVGREAEAVDLDGRREAGVAARNAAVAQREAEVLRQVGVDRLAARQQRRHVGGIHHLEVVDGAPLDAARGGDGLLLLRGGHHDALEAQALLLHPQVEFGGRLPHLDVVLHGDVAQAREREALESRRDAPQREAPLAVGHGPQPADGQLDHRLGDGLAAARRADATREVDLLCPGRRGAEGQKQQGKEHRQESVPFHEAHVARSSTRLRASRSGFGCRGDAGGMHGSHSGCKSRPPVRGGQSPQSGICGAGTPTKCLLAPHAAKKEAVLACKTERRTTH